MPYKEKHVNVEDAFVKGAVLTERDVKLEIVTYRKQRDGTFEELHTYVHVDIHAILCVRDTMRKLAATGIAERKRITENLESWLGHPHNA